VTLSFHLENAGP